MPSMAPRKRSLSVPIGNICPCPCQGITAETVLDAANVGPDQAHRISVAVKYRSAVSSLIMNVSLIIGWTKYHNNTPWFRHDPRVLRPGSSVTQTEMPDRGRGCVKTPQQFHPSSPLQTQRETLLIGLRACSVLLVSNRPQLKIRPAWKRSQAVVFTF